MFLQNVKSYQLNLQEQEEVTMSKNKKKKKKRKSIKNSTKTNEEIKVCTVLLLQFKKNL